MNFFAHVLPHLDHPYFAIGCCIPDLLSVVDRKCRAREKNAMRFIDNEDPVVASIARGVVQHHRDDNWFHQTPIFNQLILKFAVELRGLFGNERTMRPSFVGHVIVEMFLDSFLKQKYPGRMERFYDQLADVDNDSVQNAINRFATRSTDKLSTVIERFQKSRFLFDYDTNEGVVFRMNQVLKRVALRELDGLVLGWLPEARKQVYNHAPELLFNYAVEV